MRVANLPTYFLPFLFTRILNICSIAYLDFVSNFGSDENFVGTHGRQIAATARLSEKFFGQEGGGRDRVSTRAVARQNGYGISKCDNLP